MSWWRSTKRAEAVAPPREKLLEVAQKVAAACGWPWLEPVEIALESAAPEDRTWSVHTNCHCRGRNIRIVIREADFSVVRVGYLPR
jgi:hypothetical protein